MIQKINYDRRIQAIHTLRINVKALAMESRLNRQEQKRCGAIYRNLLQEHRRGKLREEARYTLLALAFVRGKPYRSAEQKTNKTLDVKRLTEKIKRHFAEYLNFVIYPTESAVNIWINKAA